MTVESEIISAMNEALNQGWDPTHSGILEQILNEQLHALNIDHVAIGNRRRKDLRIAVRQVHSGKLPPYEQE
jgi:hypothetical protein